MVLTWLLVGGGALLLAAGIVWAWRNRPVRGPEDWGEGDMKYLQAQNIARAQDSGFSQKYRDHHED